MGASCKGRADLVFVRQNTLAKLHIASETKPAQGVLQRLPRGDDDDMTDHHDRSYPCSGSFLPKWR
jgi:hypothetical protein